MNEQRLGVFGAVEKECRRRASGTAREERKEGSVNGEQQKRSEAKSTRSKVRTKRLRRPTEGGRKGLERGLQLHRGAGAGRPEIDRIDYSGGAFGPDGRSQG